MALHTNVHDFLSEEQSNYRVVGSNEQPRITPQGLIDANGMPIAGVMFKDCLSPSALGAFIDIAGSDELPVGRVEQFDHVYGLGPNLWQRSFVADHKAATHNWHEHLNKALPTGTLERTLELVRSIAGDQAVEHLQSDGDTLPFITLRIMTEGGCLGTHAHLEFYAPGSLYANDPILNDLMPQFELSCLLMLQNCDSGGELRLHNASYPTPVSEASMAPHQTIDMPVGSLLVFDAARIYHEVTPVVGRERITAGFWLSYSRGQQRLLAWS